MLPRVSYDHTDTRNLDLIEYLVLDRSNHEQAAHIVAFVIAERMMIPRHWSLKLAAWLARLRHPKSKGYAVLAVTLRKPECRDLCYDMLKQTLNHLTYGRDQSDPNSAGGFNAGELRRFINACKFVGVL